MDLNETIRTVENQILETEWRVLGRELGLTDPELGCIDHDYRHNGLKEIIHQMLLYWNNKQGKENVTKENLVTALLRCGHWLLSNTIYADDAVIKNSVEVFQQPIKDSLTNEEKLSFRDLKATLRKSYFNSQLSRSAWEEKNILPLDELNVKLNLSQVDKRDDEGTTIILEQVFQMNKLSPSSGERYLIEGGPRYGKTTMLSKICYDWAIGKRYVNDQFDLVIILHLRELRNFEALLSEISKKKYSYETMDELLQKLQSRVLLLLDGYDELPPGEQQGTNDLNRLLERKRFPRMTVFLTTRFHYSDTVRTLGSFWNQRIEIKQEFFEQQQKEFLNKVSPDIMETKLSSGLQADVCGIAPVNMLPSEALFNVLARHCIVVNDIITTKSSTTKQRTEISKHLEFFRQCFEWIDHAKKQIKCHADQNTDPKIVLQVSHFDTKLQTLEEKIHRLEMKTNETCTPLHEFAIGDNSKARQT